MIDWMQKHKKWLIITIWISTIAFIAAGMVGWGTYSFNLDQGVVAQVGKIKVTQKQYQTQFRQLFNQYNSGGGLDLQKAKELGLDEIALSRSIERALLQNFALDLGLYVGEQEVASEIAKIPAFQESNALGEKKFSLKLYQEVLKNNQLIASEFEEEVKQDLLIKKALALLPKTYATLLEKETFLFPFEVQDELKIQILPFSQFHPQPTKKEIEDFWKKNEKKFLYPAEYKIDYVLVQEDSQNPSEQELLELYEETKNQYVDEQEKIKDFKSVRNEVLEQKRSELAEEKALQEYVALKNAKERYGKEEVIIEGEKTLGVEVQEAIEGASLGETFKPIKTAQGYIVFKLVEKKPQSPKTFADAQEEAREMLILELKSSLALKKAQELLKTDLPKTQIYQTSLLSPLKLQGLSDEENHALTAKILASSQAKGLMNLNEKVVVYELKKQDLQSSLPETLKADSQKMLELYKEQMIEKEFFKYLENKYKITRNISLKSF